MAAAQHVLRGLADTRAADAGGANANFVTLEDQSDIYYHMGRAFEDGVAIGFRWNDPAFGIEWPVEPLVISERDRTYPDFVPELLTAPPDSS